MVVKLLKPWIYAAVTFFLQNNHQLFAQGKNQTLRFVGLMLLSLVLMFADERLNALFKVRYVLSWFLSPLHYVVHYPSDLSTSIRAAVHSKYELLRENHQLQHQNVLLNARLVELSDLSKENERLRGLLSTASMPRTSMTEAEVLATDINRSRQLLVLNKGRRDGAFVGQVVMDEYGIMGQLVDVAYITSTLLLISDSRCAVPVRNQRTEERAILMGTNQTHQLSLMHLPKTSTIQLGDVLLTSGLGQLYPEGYPVGVVEQVVHHPGDAFIKVMVRPASHLNQSRLVLLLWPEVEHQQWRSEAHRSLFGMDVLV